MGGQRPAKIARSPEGVSTRSLDEVFNQQYLALRLTFIASRIALVQGMVVEAREKGR